MATARNPYEIARNGKMPIGTCSEAARETFRRYGLGNQRQIFLPLVFPGSALQLKGGSDEFGRLTTSLHWPKLSFDGSGSEFLTAPPSPPTLIQIAAGLGIVLLSRMARFALDEISFDRLQKFACTIEITGVGTITYVNRCHTGYGMGGKLRARSQAR